MIIELKPLDTLFFRDGKPFNKGDETWADAIFPPSPATIYGALRTAFFNENIEIFENLKTNNKLNTDDDPTTHLKINNIFIKSDSDILFKTPFNFLQNKKGKNKNVKSKLLEISNSYVHPSNKNLRLMINDEDELLSYQQSYFYELDFADYLKKSYSNISAKKISLFDSEPKVGIAIDSQTGISDEANLYRVDMIRLKKDITLVIDFIGLDIKGEFLKLGGEGKFVFGEICNNSYEIHLPEIDKKFLLYLSTPAIFKNGWLPSWIEEETLIGTIPNTNLKVKLQSVAIGKPDLIGGFDMAKRTPKPMFKAVPSGSVYYFEILEGSSNELKIKHQQSISDIYPEQGFGICYVGKF